ncbi:MAG: hypothetical protein ACKO45_11400, partial [Cyanobium sp.]
AKAAAERQADVVLIDVAPSLGALNRAAMIAASHVVIPLVPDPPGDDPHCLAQLRHFRSLMPLAQEARKPMFHLTPADGALGGHLRATLDCRKEFRGLAMELARRCELPLP